MGKCGRGVCVEMLDNEKKLGCKRLVTCAMQKAEKDGARNNER